MSAKVIQLVKYFNPEGKLTVSFKENDSIGILEWVERSGFSLQEAVEYMTKNDNDPVFGTSLVFPSSTTRYMKKHGAV